MSFDPASLAAFYASPRGAIATRALRAAMRRCWPGAAPARATVLGLGYPAPYLRPWRDGAARCIAAVTAASSDDLADIRWPRRRPSMTCAVEDDALPLPDLSVDLIVMVHALEFADNARRLLREVWRVLADNGQLLVVVANRRGAWAHLDATPFGHGQPYSLGQASRLLRGGLFEVERRDTALFLPPMRLHLPNRVAAIWEAAGHAVAPGLGGVILIKARKDVYGVLPTASRRRAEASQGARRRVLVSTAPTAREG